MLDTIEKTDKERLDYTVLCAPWLTGGDTLVDATGEVTNSSAQITSVDTTGTQIRFWLEGGDAGDMGEVSIVFRTAVGRKKEVKFRLNVRGF